MATDRPHIRPFRDDDAAELAELVRRCLREVNSRDYPPETIDGMCAHFTPARFVELSRTRRIYVAELAERPVGTVSRDGNKVYTMFVSPDHHGRGTGRHLMQHIETQAAEEGHDHMETGASITAHHFYKKRGYIDIRTSESELAGLNYILRKPLR